MDRFMVCLGVKKEKGDFCTSTIVQCIIQSFLSEINLGNGCTFATDSYYNHSNLNQSSGNCHHRHSILHALAWDPVAVELYVVLLSKPPRDR